MELGGDPEAALLAEEAPPFEVVEAQQATTIQSFARNVYLYVNVFSVSDISTTGETFNANFYIRAQWAEPELKKLDDFDAKTAWTPHIQFMNAIETPELQDEQVKVVTWRRGRDGSPVVQWSCKVRCAFRERFELKSFPFDVQDLTITLSMQQTGVTLYEDRFDGSKSLLRDEFTVLPDFTLDGPFLKPRKELALGKFHTLEIRFLAKRRISFHAWNVFFPVFLLTAMQFSVFAVDVGEVADRLSVTLTLVLASVAYKYVVSQNLPNISYLTLCDVYVLGSFVFMAAVVMENTLVGFASKDDIEQARSYDLLCRHVFQGVFAVAHALYFVAVLVASWRRDRPGFTAGAAASTAEQ
jgi:hypothetical protein